jgi:hypothetical protein
MNRYLLNRFIFAALLLSLISVARADNPPATTQPGPAVDLSTPLAAVITYFHAIDAGDIATARKASIHDDNINRFIDAVVAENNAQQDYRKAAIARFGNDQRLADLGSSDILIQLASTSKTHENGDKADIGEHGDFPCTKVDGQWHFDLVRQNPDAKTLQDTIIYLGKSADNYHAFTRRVEAGEWKSLDEAMKAMGDAAPEPPPPPGGP